MTAALESDNVIYLHQVVAAIERMVAQEVMLPHQSAAHRLQIDQYSSVIRIYVLCKLCTSLVYIATCNYNPFRTCNFDIAAISSALAREIQYKANAGMDYISI